MSKTNFKTEIEYRMPRTLAKDLLKNRKGDEKKLDNQKFLCDYINREYGLLGYCTKVSLID